MSHASVTLTGTYLALDGTPDRGYVYLKATTPVVLDDTDQVLSGVIETKLDIDGHFSITVPASDDPNLNPTNFGYQFWSVLAAGGNSPYQFFALPAATPNVDITDVLVTDPTVFQPSTDFATQAEMDAALAALNASNLTSGTVNDARLAGRIQGAGAVSTDLNTITLAGWYVTDNTGTNTPTAGTYWNVLHLSWWAGNFSTQFAFDIISGKSYFRQQYSGTWNAWRETSPEHFALAADQGYSDLFSWFVALANRRKKRANVVMMGDSIVEGYGLTTWADTLPAQLAAALRAKFGVSGGGRGFIGPQTDPTHQPFWPISPSAGTGGVFGYGANDILWQATAAGQHFTLTVPPGGITSFDVVYLGGAGGADFYYKVDGGAAVPVTIAPQTFGPYKYHVAVPAAASVEVGFQSIGLNLVGLVEYNGDENSGVQVHNCGLSGTTAANWNSYAGLGWTYAQGTLNPDLVVINIGTNDALTSNGNKTPAAFKTDLLALIANVRSYTSVPIVLTAAYDTVGTNANAATPWSAYVQQIKDVAAADTTITAVDLSWRMPSAYAADPLDLYNDALIPHGNAKAYALMAETIANAIKPV